MPAVGHPLGIPARFLTAWMATTEGIACEAQREATGTTAAPTPTDHGTAYPSGGASKTIKAVAIPSFQPGRSAKTARERMDRPKNGRIRSRDR